MKKSKALLIVPVLLAIALFGVAFAPSPAKAAGEPIDATIVDIAVANPGFSTLVAALQAADLVDVLAGPGPFTVFAPTNEAFAAALSDLGITADQLFADKELLTSVLLYHVVPGKLFSWDVAAQGTLTMIDGSPATFAVTNGVATIAGAEIDRVDIHVNNGVIHVLNEVMLPPALAAAPAAPAGFDATIVDIALANPGFSTLVAALQAADLVDVLAGPGPFTVFAPTNEAFAALLSELGITADELFANKELLTAVLLYHVAPGEYFSTDVLSMSSITMIDGNPAAITMMGGKAYIDGAEIDRVDINVSNGVIHVIHGVMLP